MLSKKVLVQTLANIEEIDAQIAALKAARDAEVDLITKEMDRRGLKELSVGNKLVRWTEYVQNRFDSSGFKKAHPDIFAAWQKQVTGHRFTIS